MIDAPKQFSESKIETEHQAPSRTESEANQPTNISTLAHSLRAENLKKSYRGRCVVNDVSIIVAPREIVGLLGPNGAGKTTTFYMVLGLERPDAGQILLGLQDITRLPIHKRARSGISYLPQEASIFRKLTVEENILAILETLKLSRKERHEKLEQLLEDFHLGHVRRNKGYALSGGERRRTEKIGRASCRERVCMLV